MNERTQRLLMALAEAPDGLVEADEMTEEERRSPACRTGSAEEWPVVRRDGRGG